MTVRAVSNNPVSPFYNANAPNLTGQTGSLTSLLDAVLVNGFTGFTNLGWSINQTTTNKRGYKQNLTGANNSSGMLLYVDDTGPTTAKEARVCGFETMSAITPTGTGQFPTSAQSSIGTGQLVIRKSTTADATVRYWTIVGNGQTFYLFTETGDNTAPLATCFFLFGDFKSFKTSDAYAVAIMGRTVENSGSSINEPFQNYLSRNTTNFLGLPGGALGATCFGHFVARSWTGAGGSVKIGKIAPWAFTISGDTNGNSTGTYCGETQVSMSTIGSSPLQTSGRFAFNIQSWPAPNGPDGALALGRTWISHGGSMRGYFPGLWTLLHDRAVGHNDSFTVTGGDLNGKSLLGQNFQAYILQSANAENGVVVVETSDTWT
jgi:hypothetical protein